MEGDHGRPSTQWSSAGEISPEQQAHVTIYNNAASRKIVVKFLNVESDIDLQIQVHQTR